MRASHLGMLVAIAALASALPAAGGSSAQRAAASVPLDAALSSLPPPARGSIPAAFDSLAIRSLASPVLQSFT